VIAVAVVGYFLGKEIDLGGEPRDNEFRRNVEEQGARNRSGH
jgi:hypothetical protein